MVATTLEKERSLASVGGGYCVDSQTANSYDLTRRIPCTHLKFPSLLSSTLSIIEPLLEPPPVTTDERFLFAGHQTFPLRISWLPKAAKAIGREINPFSDPRVGMQILGIGKNMVESLRCWVEFYGVGRFDETGRQPGLTEFGKLVFGQKGYDPFLEDEQTLWLLHWNASTSRVRRFFAWHWVCNVQAEPEFSYDEALRAFKVQSDTYARPLSSTTLKQHLDVFLGTYVQTSAPLSGAVAEDLLESPLVGLGFLRRGEPKPGTHGKDISYAVDVGSKPGLSDELFRFCVHSGWAEFARNDITCSYRQIGYAVNSPGRVFRLPERDLHERLQRLALKWPDEFSLTESNNQRQLRRLPAVPKTAVLLRAIYERGE